MDPNCNVSQPLGNARYGGGTAGKEGRYKRPAVDTERFDEAKATITGSGKWQGEAGQVIGAYANTMDGPPRGSIMGAQWVTPGHGQVPARAFTAAGAGPRPNAGMTR